MEEIHGRHQKEKRDLQSRLLQKKKNATKKTRKGVGDGCESLERELHERHKVELDAFTTDTISNETAGASLDVHPAGPDYESDVGAKEGGGGEYDKGIPRANGIASQQQPSQATSKKPNRQKARLARRAAEQEAQAAVAAEEAASLPDLREQEMTAMGMRMKSLGLSEISIRPDGHCMYSAIATVLPEDRLGTGNPSIKPYQSIRNATADFISENPNDFAAFLEEPLETYVSKIKDTAEWGGQLELQAIARTYGLAVNVLQADGRVEKIEADCSSQHPPVWLAYYRHSFGLGEHYNALKKAS